MRKEIVAVLIVVTLIAGGLSGYWIGWLGVGGQLAKKEAHIVALETQIATLQERLENLTALEQYLAERNKTIQELGDHIEQLREQLAARNATITALIEKLNRRNATIQDLQERIAELEDIIAQLRAGIEKLEQLLQTQILGVYFSPGGGCEAQVIYWIGRANVSIHVLIYSFTLDSIGDALIAAHKRGVEVMVVFESNQITQYSEYQRLKEAGVPVHKDTNPNLMHHKVMIVDQLIVLTGSFNWSKSAEKNNNENLIVIRSTYVASVYEGEFQRIWAESTA